jgi:hypothetical protein
MLFKSRLPVPSCNRRQQLECTSTICCSDSESRNLKNIVGAVTEMLRKAVALISEVEQKRIGVFKSFQVIAGFNFQIDSCSSVAAEAIVPIVGRPESRPRPPDSDSRRRRYLRNSRADSCEPIVADGEAAGRVLHFDKI